LFVGCQRSSQTGQDEQPGQGRLCVLVCVRADVWLAGPVDTNTCLVVWPDCATPRSCPFQLSLLRLPQPFFTRRARILLATLLYKHDPRFSGSKRVTAPVSSPLRVTGRILKYRASAVSAPSKLFPESREAKAEHKHITTTTPPLRIRIRIHIRIAHNIYKQSRLEKVLTRSLICQSKKGTA
jgi:hypothetical protein